MPPELTLVTSSSARVPPYDAESEAAVLAGILVSGNGQEVDQVASLLKPEHFYSESHRRIYEACLALHTNGKPVDIVMVGTWLREQGRITQVGGMAYVMTVANADTTLGRLEHYARTIHGKWRLRQAIAICQRVAAEGYSEGGDVQEFLDKAEQSIHEVARSQTTVPFERLGVVVRRVVKAMQVRAQAQDLIVGVSTGMEQIDAHISGLVKGTLTIIAARPGDGKSAIALNMAANIAAPPKDPRRANRKPQHVAFFCLEMENEELGARVLSAEAEVDQGHIYNVMQMRDYEWGALMDSVTRLNSTNLHLCDDPNINVFSMRAMTRRLRSDVERGGGELVAVFADYLQLMEAPDMKKGEGREREVSKISRSLKKLAKELQIPVIALSQLNRQVEQRAGASAKPKLSDLRESGSIEQDANNVLLIHREMYQPKDERGKPTSEKPYEKCEIIIAKARNGRKGSVAVKFDGQYTRFRELPKDEREPGYDA